MRREPGQGRAAALPEGLGQHCHSFGKQAAWQAAEGQQRNTAALQLQRLHSAANLCRQRQALPQRTANTSGPEGAARHQHGARGAAPCSLGCHFSPKPALAHRSAGWHLHALLRLKSTGTWQAREATGAGSLLPSSRCTANGH